MEIDKCDEFYYRVQSPDEDIYKKFNTSNEGVVRNNDKLSFYAGEWIKIKVNDYVLHIVKPTETLEKISEIYCVEKSKIIFDNNVVSEKLFIGQTLKIYK